MNAASDHLMCPNCLEALTREDVEDFGRCPYCDHQFDPDTDLEEFILRPVVRQWLRQAHAQEGVEPPR